MPNAMQALQQEEEWKAMGRLADFQQYLIRRYTPLLAEERDRDDFQRHVAYLVHLTYREAQSPLVKQLTDFVMTHNRPILYEVPK